MSTDEAGSKTSEFLDSVLRTHQGIERQNTFEEVSASFVTGGRSDAIPPPAWSSTLSVPLQKPFKDQPPRREKRLAISPFSKTESFRTGTEGSGPLRRISILATFAMEA